MTRVFDAEAAKHTRLYVEAAAPPPPPCGSDFNSVLSIPRSTSSLLQLCKPQVF